MQTAPYAAADAAADKGCGDDPMSEDVAQPDHAWVQEKLDEKAPLPDWLRDAPPALPLEGQPVRAVDSLAVYLPAEKAAEKAAAEKAAGADTQTSSAAGVSAPAAPPATVAKPAHALAPVTSLTPPLQRGRSLLPGSSRHFTNHQTASLSPVSRIRPRTSVSQLALAAAAAAAGDVPSSPEAGLLRPRANPREFLSPSPSRSPARRGASAEPRSSIAGDASGEGAAAMAAALAKLSMEPRARTPPTPRSSAAPQLPTLSPAALAAGYYSAPSLEALAAAAAADAGALTAVSDFIVGCRGAGSVRFLAPVDLSGAPPLDRIVQLAPGSRTVSMFTHTDGPVAPPAGTGLNVVFEASLLRVFPRHGTLEHFREKLRRAPGTRFLSYDGADGTWRFRCDPE
jgi:hypothetical protein